MTNNFNTLKSAYTETLSQTPATGASDTLGYAGTSDYTTTVWNGYNTIPFYVDRTQKAFSIAKWLMDSKLIKIASVPEFITLIDGLASRV